MQRQRLAVDGLLEPVVQQIFFGHFFAHRRLVSGHLAAPGVFGVVHGNVGVAQQRGGVLGVFGQAGHANAGAQIDVKAVDLARLAQHAEQLFGHLARIARLGQVRQQHGEFVTA